MLSVTMFAHIRLHAELRTIFKKLESQHGKLALLVSSMEMGSMDGGGLQKFRGYYN